MARTLPSFYIYILANGRNGTLYIGVTNDLIRRVREHKNGQIEGFTRKYKVDRLVYFEDTNDVTTAIAREKQLKAWRRKWKIDLIEANNPEWRDLYDEIVQG
jgi:putative endonuclease